MAKGEGHMLPRIVAVAVLSLSLYAVAQAGQMAWQDLRFGQLETEVSYWGAKDYQPKEKAIVWVNTHLAALLNQRPHHPDYLALEASAAAWQAYWVTDARQRDHYNQLAVNAQAAAASSRPGYRSGWEKLEIYLQRSGRQDDPLMTAVKVQLGRLQVQ